jgi:hypothetical protein
MPATASATAATPSSSTYAPFPLPALLATHLRLAQGHPHRQVCCLCIQQLRLADAIVRRHRLCHCVCTHEQTIPGGTVAGVCLALLLPLGPEAASLQ